ncbi:hypothetical protein Tco_0471895 [Tanacetum coccineum]
MLNTNNNMQPQTSSVLHTSCSTSKVQEKTQLSRSRCMNSLREVKSQFKFLLETLQDFGTMPIFKRTFSQDLDLLEQHLTKVILSQTNCNTTLTKLRTKFKNAFNLEFKERMQKYTRFNAQSFQDAMILETESELLYDNSMSGNDPDADDFPPEYQTIYDEEPIAMLRFRKRFAIAALKNDLHKLKGNSLDTKFAKTSVFEKSVLQSPRKQSVVRQPNAFKSKRTQMSKPRFASQVDVSNNLSRPVTQHYLPKRRESIAKPDHMIASSESRDSSKNMPRFSSNDMVHNHYLDKARKKTQERDRNSKTNVIPSARFQSTADDSKPKPRSTNHSTWSLPKTSSRSDLRWKPTGRIFKSVSLRWIPTGKLFDSCTSKVDSEPPHGSNVDIPNIHECKQTLDVSAGTSINVQKEQSLDLSADHVSSDPGPQCSTTVLEQDSLSPGPQSQENVPQVAETVTTSNELELLYSPMFSELLNGTSPVVSKSSAVHAADNPDKRLVMTSMIELESLFGPLFEEYFNGENQVVSKSSVVTTANASDKRQQQPESTSSTSTLATTVTADGNFDL